VVVAPLLAFLQQAFNQEGRVRRSQQQHNLLRPAAARAMTSATSLDD
jgi:hypothetical protein